MIRILLFCAAALVAMPAQAQIRLGETGLSLTATSILANDDLFRGISQTRSRPAYQIANAEPSHSSGVNINVFAPNVRYAGTDGGPGRARCARDPAHPETAPCTGTAAPSH